MWRLFCFVGPLFLYGCQPAPRLDPSKPWQIEFGRGSGLEGLDTIKLNQNGKAILHRRKSELRGDVTVDSWETTTVVLSPEKVAKILDAVAENRLLELSKAYHSRMHDGTQWVLWVRQGEWEKAVYFNNRFPDSIVQFAKKLDGVLTGEDSQWHAVPDKGARDHERDLWDSIKR
ncbi:hypothetical protein VT84_26315 [Gemmata sp. SH-PL17]|uniref:DUF695 domain-containing protein n=1 Tax=Gemmata palustris TaxID=2822762 RepID=A0ABS5BPS8_9BACT|nr:MULTISPECIES: hypothetical protein [Gemmata]AMV27946.1 hypothetical protein VT84_26315 [Gemmata sp. SH-PL17]MBP3955732.1 hypothetical protein [Gemmata palustris]